VVLGTGGDVVDSGGDGVTKSEALEGTEGAEVTGEGPSVSFGGDDDVEVDELFVPATTPMMTAITTITMTIRATSRVLRLNRERKPPKPPKVGVDGNRE
jgi:hypothetical protein